MSRSPVRSLLAVILIAMLCLPLMAATAQGDETATVTSFRAPLHAEPDARSDTLADLSRGTLLNIVGYDDSRATSDGPGAFAKSGSSAHQRSTAHHGSARQGQELGDVTQGGNSGSGDVISEAKSDEGGAA